MDELSVEVPTKAVRFVFRCKCWLAKDRGDGLTARLLNVQDAEIINISQKVRACVSHDKIFHLRLNFEGFN